MKLLAIDSSGIVASIAILEDEILLGEYTINHKKTHSQTLLPMLDEVVKMTEVDLDSIDAIAVAAGPGSFTGLRIGAATAKGLGLALKKTLIPVSTVEALAYNLYDAKGLVCPIMDARRNQVYTGVYGFEEHKMREWMKPSPMGIEELLDFLEKRQEDVVFLGDGVPVFQKNIQERLGVRASFAPAHLCRQRAGAVGALGMIRFAEGKVESAADHKPDYLRMSQAERERTEREAKKK